MSWQETNSAAVSEAENSHHHKHYLKDGVVFLVEDCLFKVPRYMLENTSPIFSSMFAVPSGQNQPEGQTDAMPIRLLDTSRVDFEHLMEFLYPLTYDDLHKPVTMDEPQWTSILRLATRWEMDAIRELAITNLQTLIPNNTSPMKRILLGREFDIPQWIKTGFTGLCLRQESLTEADALQLGLAEVVKFAAARDRVRGILYSRQTPYVHSFPHRGLKDMTFEVSDVEHKFVDDWEVRKVINDIFGETGLEPSEGGSCGPASLAHGVRILPAPRLEAVSITDYSD